MFVIPSSPLRFLLKLYENAMKEGPLTCFNSFISTVRMTSEQLLFEKKTRSEEKSITVLQYLRWRYFHRSTHSSHSSLKFLPFLEVLASDGLQTSKIFLNETSDKTVKDIYKSQNVAPSLAKLYVC